jgi:hypothetical protein
MSDEIAGDVVARRDAFTAMRDIYVTAVLGKAAMPENAADYQRERPVFVQYTNPEVLACYGLDVSGAHGDLMLNLTCGLGGMDGRLLSARRLEPVLHWLRIHEFVHRTASWEELLRLRSLPEFGFVIERLFTERSVGPLRLAALKASAEAARIEVPYERSKPRRTSCSSATPWPPERRSSPLCGTSWTRTHSPRSTSSRTRTRTSWRPSTPPRHGPTGSSPNA